MDKTGINIYLSNREGSTPFDNLDSLDRLELELIQEEEERSSPTTYCKPPTTPEASP